MARKKIIILGAGVTGLSAAWHLNKKGADPIVFEKESQIGGLCRSRKLRGFTFDYCGHLLHFKNSYTFSLISKLLTKNLKEHQRNAWVYYAGKFVPYPFQANLYGLPQNVIQECLSGFIQSLAKRSIPDKRDLNFYDWVNSGLGKGIARHFMIPYNAKFWTVSPKKLTFDWADGFIPIPGLDEFVDGTISRTGYRFGYNTRFWYPKIGGIERLPLALAQGLKNVHLGSGVVRIDIKKRVLKTRDGRQEKFDYLISTIPLPDLPRIIPGLPGTFRRMFRKLKWNSILNLNLGLERKDCLKRHWIYFSESEPCFFRVGFFNNFSASLTPRGASSLYAEVAYSPLEPIDKSVIFKKIKKDLQRVGILLEKEKILVSDTNDIKYGYPVYDFNRQKSVTGITNYLKNNRIFSIGRYGSWKYLSMEEAILEGREAAEKLFRFV